ncbi:MAG TPA: hypothetical protein VH639_06640 [Bryobacteraceae bacterium]|jgi:hypothetical protein
MGLLPVEFESWRQRATKAPHRFQCPFSIAISRSSELALTGHLNINLIAFLQLQDFD